MQEPTPLRRCEIVLRVYNPKAKLYIDSPSIQAAFHKFVTIRTEEGYDSVEALVEDYDGKINTVPIERMRFTDIPPLAPLDDVPPLYDPLEIQHNNEEDTEPVIH